MKMSYSKKLAFTAVCAVLCVVLPLAFHAVNNAGQIFLPMHIPVLLCGLMCGWPYGLIHEDDLAAIFGKYLIVTVKRSDDRMYQVTGRK